MTKNDWAVSISSYLSGFFAGAVPATCVLLLFTDHPAFGWWMIFTITSALVLTFVFGLITKDNVTVRTASPWQTRYAGGAGAVAGFATTFAIVGRWLELF